MLPKSMQHSVLFQFYCKNYLMKMVDYLKKALIYGHTSRISTRIYYQFTTFKGRALICHPESCKPQYQHSIEKINEN